MANNIQQLGTTQTGTKNAFIGDGIFTLVAQTDPFLGTVRIKVTGAAGNNPTNWIVKISQGSSVEEWSGTTSGNSATSLTLNDVFFTADESIQISIENDEPLDTAVTVSTSLYTEKMPATLQSDHPVERSLYDTNPITFNFDGPSLVLNGFRSINNAAYTPVSGAVTYLRTEDGIDLYTLAYNVNDRPTGEGTVRYRFIQTGWVGGDYERFLTLRVTSNVMGQLSGDVTGKVLGGGAGVIAGTGVQSQLVDGAITVSKIADNAITAAKIATGAFTSAKFASGAFDAVWTVAARTLTSTSDSAGVSTLLTRVTALIETKAEADTRQTALVAEINQNEVKIDGVKAKTDQLMFTGANVNANAQVVSDKTGYGLADGAITAVKIAADAITSVKIADNAITAAKIAADAITSVKIADNTITATKIATGAFTSAKFAVGAFDAVWTVATRTLTATSDSAGITTLLSRITALLETKAEADTRQTTLVSEINQNEVKIDGVKAKTDQLQFTGANVNANAQVVADKTGFALTVGERVAIATAVEQAILDDSDGQAILNAIVGAIGNQNIDQIALVAAIRADIERNGGMLEILPTLSEIEASLILAKQSGFTGLATSANVTAAQTAIVTEVNQNEVKIDGVKAQTDQFTFTLGNVNANSQVVSDKTGYGLAAGAVTSTTIADNAITAAKIATDAITAAKIADGTITVSKIADNAITAAKIATGAFTSAKFAAGAFDAVWTVAARTLTATSDSAGVSTLLSRITALLETKAEADTRQTTLVSEINANEVKIDGVKTKTDQFTFTLGNVNANSQVVSDKTGYGLTAGAVTSTTIADNAITAPKIATDAITAAKIAADAITVSKIADGAITAPKIATGAFTSAKFAAGAFDAVWTVAARTLTATSDSAGVSTLLTRVTGLLETKAEADTRQTALVSEINQNETKIDGVKAKTDQLTFTGSNLHADAKVVSDKTGYSLTAGERTAIAVAVEQAILDDSDGQAILNAIVGAIGNQNIDQIALVAAIRADIERNGGMLEILPTLSEIEASLILAKQSGFTGLATAADVTAAQGTIVGEINQNEVKIDGVKTKTDQLVFTAGNVHANAQTVSDKTGYGLADGAITATKIVDSAFTSTKFAAGAFDAVWTVAARTLTATSDSAGVSTLLDRVTGLLRTKAEDIAADFIPATMPVIVGINNDKTGYSLTAGERSAIAVAVEQAILDEADGQAILNAIVGAIGNQNIDQIALVAAIRADIERNGGMLEILPTLSEIEASLVLAKQSGFTGLATAADVTAAQAAIVGEINQNEAKIDDVKAKTDQFTFTLGNVNANAQVIADKTGYNLADNAITASKIATGAFTSTKFAAGAFDAVWTVGTRTLTAVSDSSGVSTLLSRVTGLLETKIEADTRQTSLVSEINQNEVKIDGIKAKTDSLTFTGSNLHADAKVVSDKTGYSLTTIERSAIAVAVEQAILNDGDGQAILNAIVGAIGNQNIDQIALVAAIRADIERNGGMLDIVPTLSEIEASLILAKQSGFTGLATATNVTAAQTAIVAEINQNEAKIDSVKAKTDQLTFTAGDVHANAQVVADKTGYSLTSAERTAIAVAVEQAILDDGDGQAILNAIIGAIGNQNIDQIALVAAIRADIERNGGMLEILPTLSEIEASLVLAKQSGFTGLATSTGVTAAQAALTTEINQNEAKIDAVKAKTDQFTFTGSYVNADSKTVSDKTGYGLVDGAITATKIVDGTLTTAKFAAGAFDAVWTVDTRTITATSDSAGVSTLLGRVPDVVRTKTEDDAAQTALVGEINQNEVKIDAIKAQTDRLDFSGIDGALLAQTTATIADVSTTNFGFPIERSPGDQNPITFSFNEPSLSLIGTRSINNGPYAPVSGSITFLRTEGGLDFYTLSYHANDRTSTEGVVTYRFIKSGWVSGDLERFVTLRIATDIVGTVTGSITGNIIGDVTGKVLGGGAGVISGTGVQSQLVDGAITVSKIADGAITAPKIATGAFTSAKFAAGAFDAVWTVAARTLTTVGDSAGVSTLLGRVTGLLETKTEADARQTAIVAEINQNEVKIDGIKAKTDSLTFTGSNLHADAKIVSDKTGYALTAGERAAIAVAVEQAILDEADGQAILNAIVGAIGNQNIDQIALVAAIRADIERNGGMLEILPTLAEIEASLVLAKQSGFTGLATSANVTAAQAALVSEINQNEVKIDGVKAKTDQLTFTGTNLHADAKIVSDKTGYSLTAGERTAIAVAVEQAILDDGDGQAILNAIVGAIGNQNIDQIALVAAIRADIERNGGMLEILPTLAEIEASLVLAKQSGFTGLATAANVTAAQTAIVSEIDANEVKIDAVKAKTDQFTFTLGNVHANAQVVSDKTGYGLTAGAVTSTTIADGAITANKIATGAFTSTKFAAGAFDAVWTVATRTLTTVGDSTGVSTLLSRVTGLLETKTEADTRQTALVNEINQNEVKIDGIKAKTDQLTFTGTNLHADAKVVSDKTGYSLTSAERSAIATAVEQAILDEADGQAILNAIVGAIGNQNIDQIALVAAIRADIERNGGMLEILPTLAEIEASLVLAKQSGFTGLATSANVTAAQTAIVSEINQNEVKIDAVRAKTDQLTFTGTNVNANSQVISDKTGYTLTAGERTAIAVAVEQAILDDSDGQAILNAIVGAIGNQNIDQIALVAAIRTDIERNGGMLEILPTLAEIEASLVLAKQSGFTGLATSANVTAAQTALTSEINQNEVKIDAVKAKTDSLTFTLGNVNANSQIVSDKTDYGLADNAITAAKIATGAFTSAKFAAGAFDAVWTVATRTLTTVGDSAGVSTLLGRVTGLIETKAEADTRQTTLISEINANEVKIDGIKAQTDQFTFTLGNVHANAQVVADKTGYSLTAGERTAIAVAVEQAILDDGDGQAILNAIVGAIGNQNIDQIALVAAIRADIERNGGMLEILPTLTEIEASLILAKQSGFTGLATTANVTAAQTAIVAEVDANEVKIDAVKAKTDSLTFTGTNLHTDAKIVSDKTDYDLADGAITAAKIATGAFTSAKFAAGAFHAVWTAATRTLTAASDSSGVTTLLSRVTGLLETKAEADVANQAILDAIQEGSAPIVTATISAGNTGWITIANPIGELATADYLRDCLIEITDVSTGNRQLRWVASHFLASGSAGFNPDTPFSFTPEAGDVVRVFSSARWTANLTHWQGAAPAALSGTLVQVANSAADETLLGRISGNIRTAADDALAETALVTSIVAAMPQFDYTDIAAIRSKTDALPQFPAAVGSAMTLTTDERNTLAGVIDARLLDAGDATDLIGGIVARIDNTNIDQTALVAAIKSSIFDTGSLGNKLTVDANGRVKADVESWRGVTPGNLDPNGFVPSNLAAVNGNTTRATKLATVLDNDYLLKLNVTGTLAHTNNADLFKAVGFATTADFELLRTKIDIVNSHAAIAALNSQK